MPNVSAIADVHAPKRAGGAISFGALVVFSGMIGAGAAISSIWLKPGLSVMALAPMAALLFGRGQSRRALLLFDPPLVIAATYAIFFVSGALAMKLDVGLPYISVGAVDSTFVTRTIAELSLIAGVLVLVAESRGRSFTSNRDASHQISPAPKSFLAFMHLLVATALAGVFLTILRVGNLSAAQSTLSSHNRVLATSVDGSLGAALWATFALPAAIAAGAVALPTVNSRTMRRVAFCEFTSVVFVAIYLYGSRLTLVLAFVGVLAMWSALSRQALRLRTIALLAIGILAVSIPVLSNRTGANQTGSNSIASIAGYNIFDVSLASTAVSPVLGSQLRDTHRLLLVLGSILPRAGVSAQQLAPYRADTLVVADIGGGGSTRALATGFPPSLPTALLVMFGPAFGLLFAIMLGLAIGSVTRLGSSLSGGRTWALFWYGLLVATVFDAFKGGDFEIDLASLAQKAIVLSVLYAILRVFFAETVHA